MSLEEQLDPIEPVSDEAVILKIFKSLRVLQCVKMMENFKKSLNRLIAATEIGDVLCLEL